MSRWLALAALLAVAPVAAHADDLAECESRAAFDLRGKAGNVRLRIDREALIVDRADVKAGQEFVSSVLHGPALLEAADATTTVRFICLLGGAGRGPLFVWVLPE